MYKEDPAAAAAAKAAEVEAVRWVLRGEYTEESTGARTIRQSGGKDRHSKVFTARGPRDRRVRLSVATAIRFYDLQDRLGVDQPSKAVDWLMRQAHAAIDALPPLLSATQTLAPPLPQPPPPAPPVHGIDDDDDDDVDADDAQYSATGSATSDQKPYGSFFSPHIFNHSHKRLRQSDYSSPENQQLIVRHVDHDQFSACSSSSCATTVNDPLVKLLNTTTTTTTNSYNNNNNNNNNINHSYDTLIHNHSNNNNNININNNNNHHRNIHNVNNTHTQIDSSYSSSLTLLQALLMKPQSTNLVDTKPTSLFSHLTQHQPVNTTTTTTNFAPPPHHGHLLDALYHIPSPTESISSMHNVNNGIPSTANVTTTATTTTSNSQYVPSPTLPTAFHLPMSSSTPNYEQHSATYGSLYIL